MIVFLESETFWSLLRNSAHWEFELFLMLLFDGVIFGLAWPFLRKHWKHHIARDQQDQNDRWPWQIEPYTDFVGTQVFHPDPLGEIAAPDEPLDLMLHWSGSDPSHVLAPLCTDCGGLVDSLSPTIARCLGCGQVYDIPTPEENR